uniref:Uncharacterized protein n=1 Tax=Lygus hesperus TaxID=30085 RepID=A0A0A9XX96_LYGHE
MKEYFQVKRNENKHNVFVAVRIKPAHAPEPTQQPSNQRREKLRRLTNSERCAIVQSPLPSPPVSPFSGTELHSSKENEDEEDEDETRNAQRGGNRSAHDENV